MLKSDLNEKYIFYINLKYYLACQDYLTLARIILYLVRIS